MRNISKLEKNEKAAVFMAFSVVSVFMIYLVFQSGTLADWLETYIRSADSARICKADLYSGYKIFLTLFWVTLIIAIGLLPAIGALGKRKKSNFYKSLGKVRPDRLKHYLPLVLLPMLTSLGMSIFTVILAKSQKTLTPAASVYFPTGLMLLAFPAGFIWTAISLGRSRVGRKVALWFNPLPGERKPSEIRLEFGGKPGINLTRSHRLTAEAEILCRGRHFLQMGKQRLAVLGFSPLDSYPYALNYLNFVIDPGKITILNHSSRYKYYKEEFEIVEKIVNAMKGGEYAYGPKAGVRAFMLEHDFEPNLFITFTLHIGWHKVTFTFPPEIWKK